MSKGTFRGKPLEDMSKGELIEAILVLSEMYKAASEQYQKDMELFL